MTSNNSKNSLAICVVLHQPNLSATDSDTSLVQDAWNNTLFPAITYTYIPLLKMLDHLVSNHIPVKINMVISPTLCSLLDDYIIQEHYSLWLENLLELGEQEVEKTKSNPEQNALAKSYLKNLNQIYSYYAGISQGSLLLRFLEHVNKGTIELLATTAEHCYLPHYINTPQLISAQIEAGIMAHKKYFKIVPEGFWMPSMGYCPGIESVIQEYGFDFSIVNTHGFLFANPSPSTGIFSPLRAKNSLTMFAHDSIGWDSIFGEKGSSQKSCYRNQNRDVGYESTKEDLTAVCKNDQARFATGYSYWSKKQNQTLYNIEKANDQTQKDAQKYVDEISFRLQKASEELDGRRTSLLCVINEEDLNKNWYEGIYWLCEVLKKLANHENITGRSLTELSEIKQDFEKVDIYTSSNEGKGYSENLLDNTNSWIYRYNIKAVERMIDLTQRFPNDGSLKERALNLAARIVLFSSSSDWAKISHVTWRNKDELELFVQSILDFSTLFDSLGANAIKTEWLTEAEKRYPFLSWLNYRVFCKKQ